MKKLLLITVIALMSLTNLYANYALKHANPMPNLVRYALGNAELLQLNKAQVQDIKAWSKQNKPEMRKLIKQVMTEEKMLMQESLTTDKNVVNKAQTMLDARKKIIEIKTLCRAHLKEVLTAKQYSQVVGIYRSTLPKHKKCKK